jgi:single-strand DNA-binding protein
MILISGKYGNNKLQTKDFTIPVKFLGKKDAPEEGGRYLLYADYASEKTENGYKNYLSFYKFEKLGCDANINFVSLLGRLPNDPNLRFISSGKAIANFDLAVKNGKNTTWYNKITAWEKTAEIVSNYVKKGDQLYIEGYFKSSEYNDKTYYNVVCNNVTLLGGRSNNETPPLSDDDIPF